MENQHATRPFGLPLLTPRGRGPHTRMVNPPGEPQARAAYPIEYSRTDCPRSASKAASSLGQHQRREGVRELRRCRADQLKGIVGGAGGDSPYNLPYNSDRMPSSAIVGSHDIPRSGHDVPPGVLRIVCLVRIHKAEFGGSLL